MMVGDARRHVDAQRLLSFDAAIAAARRAGVGDDGPLPRARGARGNGEQLAEQRLRLAAHFARTAAGAARGCLRPRLGAAAAARRARLEGADAHRLRGPGGDLVEGEPQGDLQVGPAPLIALRALAASEQGVEAAQVPEIAHEDAERFGEVEVREAEARPPAAQAGLSVAVVGSALVGVAQHLVGLGDLLELFLGRFVPVVAIGMVLHGEAAIRFLDLGLGGPARNAQQRVVVGRASRRATHASSSPSKRLVWSTRATILSYGIRVGPSTPIRSPASWMKMLISSPAPPPPDVASGVASRSRSASVARISWSVSPASRSFRTTATWATASAARCCGISTKMVRITPLFSVITSSSRSDET